MSKSLVAIFVFLITSQALAWRLGQPLNELRDKDFGRGVAKLGTAISDVATLGATARERDARQAKEAQLRAEAELQEAQRRLEERRTQIVSRIASHRQTISYLENQSKAFQILQGAIEANQKAAAFLLRALEGQSIERTLFEAIIRDQQTDLRKWVEHISSLRDGTQDQRAGEEILALKTALEGKVASYIDQVAGLPRIESEIPSEEAMDTVLETGFEALGHLRLMIEKTEVRVIDLRSQITQAEAEVAALQ